jgi:predicted aconitase with swiveling domain
VSSDGSETGVIDSCPISGCNETPVSYLNGADAIVGAVADATNVYWIDAPKGQVLRCPAAGCTGTPDVIYSFYGGAQDPEALIPMALDATSLYIGADEIVRVTPK